MTAATKTLEETIELLKSSLPDAIIRIAPWNDRYYINLRHENRTFAGDRNDKFYFDDRGVLIYQQGKGTNGAGFQADKRSLLAFCEANDITIERK